MRLFILLLILLLGACATTPTGPSSRQYTPAGTYKFFLVNYATDSTYGYTEANPIKVGGAMEQQGPVNERKFLNALAGPNGEQISYTRLHSCCGFKTENSPFGGGLLDVYEIVWEGQKSKVRLFINMYDADELWVPVGFTLAQ
jgi:hypothetical protein